MTRDVLEGTSRLNTVTVMLSLEYTLVLLRSMRDVKPVSFVFPHKGVVNIFEHPLTFRKGKIKFKDVRTKTEFSNIEEYRIADVSLYE